MKIAFAGKGGSGKTTLSSLFTRHLAGQGLPVVAIDADINQHLAETLGAAAEPPPMGARLTRDQGIPARQQPPDQLRRGNGQDHPARPRVHGCSGLGGPDPVHDLAITTPCGARLLATGPFTEDDLGVACYHSKTGAVELYLNHLADGPGEYVVVDCTAGADSFASGLFTRFDLTVLVAEPTRKALRVHQQWQDYAASYDLALAVAGNKVQNEEDVAFLRQHAGDDLLTWTRARTCRPGHGTRPPVRPGRSRPANHGRPQPSCTKRWTPSPGTGINTRRQAVEFHLKNARAWASAAAGKDLTAQIDPGFSLAPVISAL